MLGAMIGDVVGSRFEWDNIKTKEFDLFTDDCFVTDDSVMTFAIAKAIMESDSNFENLSAKAIEYMQKLGRKYPYCGYGGNFAGWLLSSNPKPYNSWGNGAAMRVSSVAYAGNTIEEVIELSKKVTEVTHNHPEGIKGAEATAVTIYMARTGKSIQEIKDYINEHYYKIDFKLDDIRDDYTFDVSCQGTVPQALVAFFESVDFEDAIRNAISLGGDSDTLAAIAGSIAEAYYGIPTKVREAAIKYLDKYLSEILFEFESKNQVKQETKSL